MQGLNDIVRAAREERGMTMSQFAAAVGIAQATLASVEYGGRPSRSTVAKLAAFLERPVCELDPNDTAIPTSGGARPRTSTGTAAGALSRTVRPEDLRAGPDDPLPRLLRLARKRVELSTGFRYQFDTAAGLVARMASVVEHARQCCRFFRFQIALEPHLGVISLDVSGPEAARAFLAALDRPDDVIAPEPRRRDRRPSYADDPGGRTPRPRRGDTLPPRRRNTDALPSGHGDASLREG